MEDAGEVAVRQLSLWLVGVGLVMRVVVEVCVEARVEGGLEQGVPGVSVSVGVAVADERGEPIEALIETADRALYRAKRAGRDRVVAA